MTAATWSFRILRLRERFRVSRIYMLWSSDATARLNASMGFQDMEFEAKERTAGGREEDVRKS